MLKRRPLEKKIRHSESHQGNPIMSPRIEIQVSSLLKNIYLDLPAHLPQQVSNLISECWRRIPSDRPTFLEIHYILSMKNSDLPISEKGNAAVLSSIAINEVVFSSFVLAWIYKIDQVLSNYNLTFMFILFASLFYETKNLTMPFLRIITTITTILSCFCLYYFVFLNCVYYIYEMLIRISLKCLAINFNSKKKFIHLFSVSCRSAKNSTANFWKISCIVPLYPEINPRHTNLVEFYHFSVLKNVHLPLERFLLLFLDFSFSTALICTSASSTTEKSFRLSPSHISVMLSFLNSFINFNFFCKTLIITTIGNSEPINQAQKTLLHFEKQRRHISNYLTT
uniref:Serine-threonine/tyrosine-protein kinase catalytic domain-containing protein n=1 Tax=Onchocerca volvulus TaxID=6282 RepID=A0A8R1TSH3_ONCVO